VKIHFLRGFMPMVMLLAMASFSTSIHFLDQLPVAAYYHPLPRFWEFLSGGFLVCRQQLSRDKSKSSSHSEMHEIGCHLGFLNWFEIFFLVGLSSILGSAFWLNESHPFPGWGALIPVLGSVLIICTGGRSKISCHLLGNPFSVYIGLISYSLYLWHWPLLVFSNVANFAGESTNQRVYVSFVLIFLSIVLAVITYQFIEKNVRNVHRHKVGRSVISIMLALILMGLFSCGIGMREGYVEPRLKAFNVDIAVSDWSYKKDAEILGVARDKVLFLGDSYIEQYYPRLDYLAKEYPKEIKSIIFRTAPGCAPVPNINCTSRNCIDKIEKGFAYAELVDVSTVVIGGSWLGMLQRGDYYDVDDIKRSLIDFQGDRGQKVFSDLQENLKRLIRMGKEVYIILHPPGGPEADPMNIGNRLLVRAPKIRVEALK
jgi:hypothetical protein